MEKVIVNNFAKRQTAESNFSHFEGTWNELANLAMENMPIGFAENVLIVSVPPERFFSGVVDVTPSTPLKVEFSARRESELPFLQIFASGKKSPAVLVNLVLYKRTFLGDDATDGAHEWEIISINAKNSYEPEPPLPYTMARNFLGLPGGSDVTYTAQEFARSILYWSTRAMIG